MGRAIQNALRDACRVRLDRLRENLAAASVDAILVNCETDIRYLTGFVGHDSLLMVSADDAVIVSDPRYDEFLEPWRQVDFVTVQMGVRHRLEKTIATEAARQGIRQLAVQADHISISHHRKLEASLSGLTLVPMEGVLARLRMTKDSLEIDTIRRAIRIQQDALDAALGQLALGMTEHELCALLKYEMERRGAFGASFDPIIATGLNSSIIHYMTAHVPIGPGPLLVDWGAVVDGYSSDMTRTFGIEAMPAKIREIYDIVLEAQLAAIDAIRPGVACAEIDAVARRVITDAGYGDAFAHGLGHGLGMDTHESPYFNDLQTDVLLQPGMVMTVEPGIYLPGVGGVRIEDDVLVTDNGADVLSNWPKDAKSMTLEPSRRTQVAAGVNDKELHR